MKPARQPKSDAGPSPERSYFPAHFRLFSSSLNIPRFWLKNADSGLAYFPPIFYACQYRNITFMAKNKSRKRVVAAVRRVLIAAQELTEAEAAYRSEQPIAQGASGKQKVPSRQGRRATRP